MDASALAKAEFWLSVIWWAKLLAAFFVAVGVAVEFLGDWVARPFEKTVESARTVEVETAKRQAAEATKKAGELGVSVATLNGFVKDQQATATAGMDRLKASEAALDAAIKRVDERLAPRDFTATNRDKLIALLKAAPKGPVFVVPAALDATDATSFAQKITDVLTEGGFTPGDPSTYRFLGFPKAGEVQIIVTDLAHPPAHAVDLQNAFKAVGVLFDGNVPSVGAFQKLKPDEVILAIGSHP